jgi:CRISPR-associated endoribonuclease Cas6
MRFRIYLSGSTPKIILPIHHNALIQAAIYTNLSPQLAEFLHNEGYIIDNRPFRLFVFSRIIGEYQILQKEQKIIFNSPIQLIISSPIPQFLHDITQLLLKDGFRLGNQLLKVDALEVDIPFVDKNEVMVRTLSPIVAYSTMNRPDGRKYTNYFEPREEDFKQLIIQNLKRKGKLLHGEKVEKMEFMIKPIGQYRQHLIKYVKEGRETIIKGYSGRFILQGDRTLIQTAIDVGVGAKNSSGFGLLEMNKG